MQSLVWQLDQASFDGAVVELVRRNDDIPIRLLLIRTPGEAAAAAGWGDRDEFDTILDRLTSLGAIALTLDREDLSNEVIECLAAIYQSPPATNASHTTLTQPTLWLDIVARVEALGGLATVLKKWETVRTLATQPASDAFFFSWLRHGLTMASRSSLFPTTATGAPEQGVLIPVARRVVHRLPALRPHVVDDSAYDPEPGAAISPTDAILDSLCAFDALAALVVLSSVDPGRFDAHHYYPSFVRATFGPVLGPIAERHRDAGGNPPGRR